MSCLSTEKKKKKKKKKKTPFCPDPQTKTRPTSLAPDAALLHQREEQAPVLQLHCLRRLQLRLSEGMPWWKSFVQWEARRGDNKSGFRGITPVQCNKHAGNQNENGVLGNQLKNIPASNPKTMVNRNSCVHQEVKRAVYRTPR